MTLYECTLKVLADNGKTSSDILWIGCKAFRISIENFIKLSKSISDNEDNSILEHIPIDLIVVGDGFWLERNKFYDEYWSSEDFDSCWTYISAPIMPDSIVNLNTLYSEENKYIGARRIELLMSNLLDNNPKMS